MYAGQILDTLFCFLADALKLYRDINECYYSITKM